MTGDVALHSHSHLARRPAHHPEYLAPYKTRLIRLAGAAQQQEVRWHLAQLLSRVELSGPERRRVVAIMSEYLTDTSKIVKTFAMQTLADIAADDPGCEGPSSRDCAD